jgi:PIN domain
MSGSGELYRGRLEQAFLDANVIRGQLTNDILLSLADRDVFEPRWTRGVLDEMRRNRPPGVPEERIDRRIGQMNRAFPDAMVTGHEPLIERMHADEKDKHVLAGAVHGGADVLVTENVKDFNPPSSGEDVMRVEKLSQFLSRKLEQNPERVVPALRAMVDRNRLDPRTMPALIDKMAKMPELRGFAQKLNAAVEPHERGTAPVLAANQRKAASAALDGIADARGAVEAGSDVGASKQSRPSSGPDRDRGTER